MRNTIEITIKGKTYSVVPDFATLEAIENTGVPVLRLLSDMHQNQAKVTDLVKIIHAALQSDDQYQMSYQELGNTLLPEKNGVARGAQFCSDMVASAFGAGPEKPLSDNQSDDAPGED